MEKMKEKQAFLYKTRFAEFENNNNSIITVVTRIFHQTFEIAFSVRKNNF